MKFEKLHAETGCDCLDGAKEDVSNQYVRKINKNKIAQKDFKTHWERGIRPNSQECKDICSCKGVSINRYSEEAESLILKKYKTTLSINPKKGAHLIKFQFKDSAGLVEHTPSKIDKTHYTFFKSDDFELEKVEILETVKFA